MSRHYDRYRQRNITAETREEIDRRQPAAVAAVLDRPAEPVRRPAGKALLLVEDLEVTYGTGPDPVRAVDGVSFEVAEGESVGLVGESGCGKSSLGRAVLRLTDIRAGRVLFDGAPVHELSGVALKTFREQAQMIFQDPFGSLNPRMAVGRAIREVLAVHGKGDRTQRRAKAAELFTAVGLDPDYLERYPHEFSGGQRQRIGIARALAVGPKLVIADEPVSALDVSVQVQILNLLQDLQEERGLTYLFIAHDLAVVRYVCTRILVMYLGRLVEAAPAARLYGQPLHPYTKALLSAVPDVDKGLRKRACPGQSRILLNGDVPSPRQRLPGCPFHPRCPSARDRCREEVPPLREIRLGRRVACHFAEELAAP